MDIDKIVENILKELKNLNLEALVFPSFLVNIPDTPIIVSLNRINERQFTVTTSENGNVFATENFYNMDLAINSFFLRVKDISEQIKRKKNEKLS